MAPGTWSPPIASIATVSRGVGSSRPGADSSSGGVVTVIPSRGPGARGRCRSCRTRCAGSFTAPHVGHSERAGASSVQFEARRLRVFARGVLRLGTAMAGCSSGIGGVQSSKRERAQRVPPGIGRVGVAVAVGLVAVDAAHRAQPGAILAAQRRRGQIEQHGVAHRQLEVDLLALERVGLALDRRRARTARAPASRSAARTGARQRLHSLSYSPATVPWTTMPSLMRSSQTSTTSGAADRRDPATPPSSLPGDLDAHRPARGRVVQQIGDIAAERGHVRGKSPRWRRTPGRTARVERTPDTGSATCRRAGS